MNLSDKIAVNTFYTRSVNLERDTDSPAVVKSYIPTTRALQTLARIADTLTHEQAPRAWSLVGPYGSGKSSFAAFLSYLLASPEIAQAGAAYQVLENAQADLADRFRSVQVGSSGHCIVLLTGSPESFGQRFARVLSESATAFWSNRTGPKPAILARLRQLSAREQVQVSEMLDAVVALQDAIARSGGSGLLVVIDELGKFLEYESRHYGANDIYLLQALAEQACAGHAAKMTLVVLLHQAMDQYAKGLGETLRNEWAKVQGRFENIPFIESAEQVLRVVAAAISHSLTDDEQSVIRAQALEIAKQLASEGALPKSLYQGTASELFARCYPLHPLGAMLLPILCQKVAQNERTLFSYLGSHEPHGFAESLQRLTSVGDWVLPWEIYEYFIQNQPGAVFDHYTRRRWTEVVTAVERLGDAPDAEVQLLKSVGLLNIVGAQGGLKASRDIVRLCVAPPSSAQATAQRLAKKFVLQYRKFSGEYRVWEGSDFDLDVAVTEQIERLGHFNLAEALNKRHVLDPIVARRHTIETGSLRYFVPTFADAESFRKLAEQTGEARIVFFLVEGQGDRWLFTNEVKNSFSTSDIVVECFNTDQLRQAVAETIALEAVRREAQALNNDPVAQRELKDRYTGAVRQEHDLLASLTEDPGANFWYWKGGRLEVLGKRGLQAALSEVLDDIYSFSPIVRNELINRDRPSSQAAAARNKLLAAMLRNESELDLGIEKYPAEKAIYQALLRETGIHRQIDGRWQFCRPFDEDKYNFGPTWERIEAFLTETEQYPKPFTDLDAVLQAPPFGVKAGVLPILYIAAYLTYQDEIALFEEGRFTPYLAEHQLERFVRRPGDFAVQSFRLEGIRSSIFKEYTRVLYGDAGKASSVLSIARPLVKFMGELPEYSQTTKRISPIAQAVRKAFDLAKSPHTLIFEQLPVVCGIEKLDGSDPDREILKGFTDRLKDALRELKQAYPDLLDAMRELLAQAFNLDRSLAISELRSILRGRVEGLDEYTVDVDGLRAFIRRVAKQTGTDDEWFTNVLLFLGQKPVRKWSDSYSETAEFRLSEFSRRLNDLEKLRVHYEGEKRKRGADFDVLLLRSVRKGVSERDEIVCIDDKTRVAIRTAKADLAERLAALGDRELRLAVLAELADELLDRGRQEGSGGDLKLEVTVGGEYG